MTVGTVEGNQTIISGNAITTGSINGVTVKNESNEVLIGVDGEDSSKINLSAIDRNTTAISYDKTSKTTSFEGKINATGDVTSKDGEKEYSLNTIGADLDELSNNVGTVSGNVAGIKRDNPNADYGEGTTSIEGIASFNKDGMTVGTEQGKQTIISGNAITTGTINGVTINKDENDDIIIGTETSTLTRAAAPTINLSELSRNTAGITRDEHNITSIEGVKFSNNTITTGSINGVTIKKDEAGNIVISGDGGDTESLNLDNIKGIGRRENDSDGYTTSIETTFKVHSTEDLGTIDVYGSKIESNLNGQTTVINGGSITTNSLKVGDVIFDDLVNRVGVLEEKTQNITSSNTGTGESSSVVPPTTEGQTGMEGDLIVGDKVTANSGTIGDVTMQDGKVTANNGGIIGGVTMDEGKITTGNTTIDGTGVTTDKVTVGQTSVTNDGVTVGTVGEGQSYTSITKDDVKVTDSQGNTTSLTDVGNRVTGLESSVNSMNNRLNDVEDRIDKVGAMSAAIANLRTMGFDPEAPTEIAIGVGQYKSETGIALGVFHYPNQDFMLSASISTSGDEVMGGIGATWKLGRKSAAEKAKDEEAKRLEKAEEMKKLAQEAKVKAQAERHAKLLAEREAHKIA